MPPIRRARIDLPRLAATLALALALSALHPAPASAYTWGDTLTVVWRPLPSLPSFVQPGGVLTVWANASTSVTGWAAALRFGSLTVPLTPAGGGYVTSRARWELGFTVPVGTPDELYDLVVTSAATLPDTSRHAVKVLTDYADDFDFAQITDTHLPMNTTSSTGGWSATDTSAVGDFDAVVSDLNLIHPEFVLHTGDLVNEGELEDYLSEFEMGRAKDMLSRFDAPVFLVSGNHDLGGWQATPPPDGTSRRNWWRYFGWPFLLDPPAGAPAHTQDYSFDYGLVHCIGLEGYINNGSYDHFRTDLYGAQSFTAAQMAWLTSDIQSIQQGQNIMLFYHYDFGGTNGDGTPGAAMTQVHPTPLGVRGAIWGHVHSVAEGNRSAIPFDLGLQSCVGLRTFRIFHVSGGEITPGPMHHAGGTTSVPTDSLTVSWSGANDGSRASLTAVVNNRYNEAFSHARLVFWMPDHDSSYAATGGTVTRMLRLNGKIRVEVDYAMRAAGTSTVALAAVGRLGVEPPAVAGGPALAAPVPAPFDPARGPLRMWFTLPGAAGARVRVFDVGGRVVASLHEGAATAGEHLLEWDGRATDGHALAAGVYLVRLEAAGAARVRRVVLVR